MRAAIGFDVVVVGASVAGSRVVDRLRHEGFAGTVVLVGDEAELPYDRPPLSKQFLAGDWDTDRVRLLTAERAAELDIELRLDAAATSLEPRARAVTLADGTVLRYGTVVIATGSSARPSPWGPMPGVHTLRSLADSAGLQPALAVGSRVVVIGGGYIGAEVAATALGRGCVVSVVDVAPNPYARSLGTKLGELLCSIHERHGVVARFGVGVDGVTGAPGSLVVGLADGTQLPADTVVVGIGAVPNTGWLAASGLVVDDGVVCDEYGRALGAPDVFAVGDVARWGKQRQEHWTSAVEQARAVAHTIAHGDDPALSASDGYVWSDQYTWKIQIAGTPGPTMACEIVGSLDDEPPRIAGLYRDDQGRLIGVAAVNWPKAFLSSRRVMGAVDARTHANTLRGVATQLPA